MAHNYDTHTDFALKVFKKHLLLKEKILEKDEISGKLKEKNALDDALREIQIMKTLDNACVVNLHEVIETRKTLVMVLDYCE